MQNYSRTIELTEIANNAAGASNKQFEKTQDSLESKLNKLDNAWTVFTTNIADSSTIKAAIDVLTKLLETAEKQYNQQLINGEELIFTEEDLIAIKNDLKNLKEYEKKVKK